MPPAASRALFRSSSLEKMPVSKRYIRFANSIVPCTPYLKIFLHLSTFSLPLQWQWYKKAPAAAWGAVGALVLWKAYTSWTMAISAASPRRGPILTIRV